MTGKELCERFGLTPGVVVRMGRTVAPGVTSMADIEGEVALAVEGLAIKLGKGGSPSKGSSPSKGASPSKGSSPSKGASPSKEPGKVPGKAPAAKAATEAKGTTRGGKQVRSKREEVGGGDLYDFEVPGQQVLFVTYKGKTMTSTKYGEKPIHVGLDKAGDVVKFWGKGMLNPRLEGQEGNVLEIQFTGGKVPTKNGAAKEYKVYRLEEFPSDEDIAAAKPDDPTDA